MGSSRASITEAKHGEEMKKSDPTILRDQYLAPNGLARGLEIWFEHEQYHVQDVLCRGVIGWGDTEEQARTMLFEKLGRIANPDGFAQGLETRRPCFGHPCDVCKTFVPAGEDHGRSIDNDEGLDDEWLCADCYGETIRILEVQDV